MMRRHVRSGGRARRLVLLVAAVLLAPHPAPAQGGPQQPPAGPPPAGQFKVITFNAQFLPGIIGNRRNVRDHDKYRAREIARRLHEGGYVVVGLNEMFDDSERKLLVSELRKHWQAAGKELRKVGPPEKILRPQDGGVILLTPLPISVEHEMVYAKGEGHDRLAAKGAVHARVLVGGGAVDVFATHLQAGKKPLAADAESDTVEARLKQIRKLSEFIMRKADPRNPVLLMGDMNIIGDPEAMNDPRSQYTEMIRILQQARPDIRDVWTMLPPPGPAGTSHSGKRIDYIFLSQPPGAALTVAPQNVRVEPFADPRVVSLSDHAGLEATFRWTRRR